MRRFLGILLIIMISVSTLSSCYTSQGHRRNMPPGHAKKVYGHQSARDYAPGHQKKKSKKYKKNKQYNKHKGGKGHHKGKRGNY